MQIRTNNFDNIFHLGFPMSQNTNLNFTTKVFNAAGGLQGTGFTPTKDLTLNRIAFKVTATSSPSLTIRAGLMTNVANIPISYLSSTTSTTFTTGYNTLTLSDYTLTAHTRYFAAVECSSYTSGSITVATKIINTIWAEYNEPSRYDSTAKATGLGNIIFGYNNGVSTQWYGYPLESTVARRLNANSASFHEVGAKIKLPYLCYEYRVLGIIVQNAINVNHTITCNIYESDGTTLVQNATATLNQKETAVASGSLNKACFLFGSSAILKPKTEYLVSFTCTGTLASSAYTLIYSAEMFSDATNVFDAKNTVYYRTNPGDPITDVANERLQIDLVLEQVLGSFRGTKVVSSH